MSDADYADALQAAIDGDSAGFARLWRALHPPLLRYLRVVCGDLADDVASETWLTVARHLSEFAGDATAFRVWVFRIARHRGLAEGRRAARRRDHPVAQPENEQDLAVRDVALDAIEGVQTDWALRLIASLPPAQAEAVMLRVVAGLDVAQTARVLSKRPGAVRIATLRGLRRLSTHPEVRARQTTAAAEPGFTPPRPRLEGV